MAIDSVERRSPTQRTVTDDIHEAGGGGSVTRKQRPRDPMVDQAFAKLDAAFAADLARFAAANAPKKRDDGILYIGMNPESEKAEVDALSKSGNVRTITQTSGEDDVFIGGVRYRFSDPGQVEAFVATLHLDPRVADNVIDVLKKAEKGSREKLAQIAVVFAEAERGGTIPSRLVISGHSGGLDVFGGQGRLELQDLRRLARAMPRAAACIEDIHFSTCSSAGQVGLDEERASWRAAFPNLKSMWGYAGSSGMANAKHLAAWARATKPEHDSISVPKELKGQRIAVWTKADGYRDEMSLTNLRAAQLKADARFHSFVSGALTARQHTTDTNTDPQSALADYQTYRVLSQRNDVPKAEREMFGKKADQLLRIRYYEDGVRKEFATRYGADVARAYQSLGLKPPDFGNLSRSEALARIAEFDRALAKKSPPPSEATAVLATLHGFRDLSPSVIRTSDCHH